LSVVTHDHGSIRRSSSTDSSVPRCSVGGITAAARPAAPPEWAVDSPPAAPLARCPDAAGNAVVSAAGATGSVGAVVSSGPDDPAPDDPGPDDEEAAVDGPGAVES